MNLEEANKIKTGQILYTYLKNKVVVDSIHDKISEMVFGCVNTDLYISYYSHKLLYTDIDNLCDEENSFLDFCKDNDDYITENIEYFDLIKYAYIKGYASGFNYWLYRKNKDVVV
jgi:hypothetical protein